MPAFCTSCLYLENLGTPMRPRLRCVLWEIRDPQYLPDEVCDVYEPDGQDRAPLVESGAAAQGGAL